MTFLVAGLGLVGGIALAATVVTKSLNGNVNIVANGDFRVYSDQAATQEITSINLGDVAQGTSKQLTFYVKNTSPNNNTISEGTDTVATSVGTLSLTFNGQSSVTLVPNAVATVVATLAAANTAPTGTATFTLGVNGSVGTSTTAPPPGTTTPPPSGVSFSATIDPALTSACGSCHSWATTYSGVTGSGRVVAGSAASSPLYQRVSSSVTASGHMPPGGSMTSTQIQQIADWINQGALNN